MKEGKNFLAILRPHKNKSAVSTIVGYVLLISITLSLSVLVYGWLRWYFDPENTFPQCPEGVSVVIYGVDCWTGSSGILNITLKNRGRFNVDGYYLRYHIDETANFGIYNLTAKNTTVFKPGEERVESFIAGNYPEDHYGKIKLVEVQPFRTEGGNISCMSVTTQRVTCATSGYS